MLICLFPHGSSKSGRKAPYALTNLEVEVAAELEWEKLLVCMLTSAPYCETRTNKCEASPNFQNCILNFRDRGQRRLRLVQSLSYRGQRVKQLPGARLSRPKIP